MPLALTQLPEHLTMTIANGGLRSYPQNITIPNNDIRRELKKEIAKKEIENWYRGGFEAVPHPLNASNHEWNRLIAWSGTNSQTRHTGTSPTNPNKDDFLQFRPRPLNASNHEWNRSIAWSGTHSQTRYTETSTTNPNKDGVLQFRAGDHVQRKGGCFGVLAQLQNEEHALVEWIEHYIAEGAGHFYLGSNNPQDSAGYEIFRRQVKPYEDSGILTWWDMPSFSGRTRQIISQTDNLWSTKVLDRVKMDGLVQWLLVVDLGPTEPHVLSSRIESVAV